MKRLNKNFMMLSVKQIKTYAAVLLMSTLSYEAIASDTEEYMNADAGMSATYETSMDKELSLESWMLLPFDSGMGMETAVKPQVAAPYEAEFEKEMVLESWMTVPFETNMAEESEFEFSTCPPAP